MVVVGGGYSLSVCQMIKYLYTKIFFNDSASFIKLTADVLIFDKYGLTAREGMINVHNQFVLS